MQRYALIEQVKDASVIGILVGSVVVDNYMEMIKYLKMSILSAGKKYYEVLIGKINEAKLRNFNYVSKYIICISLS
jgi:diphthamide biosynthesis protein 2